MTRPQLRDIEYGTDFCESRQHRGRPTRRIRQFPTEETFFVRHAYFTGGNDPPTSG